MIPILNTIGLRKSIFRYVLPSSMQKISQSTFLKHKSALVANKSVIFKDEAGRLWILCEKSKIVSSNYLVRVKYEALIQGGAEDIATKLNGGEFCHAYLDIGLTYGIEELHEFNNFGIKAFIALRLNKGKRISYNWNYLIKQ